MRRRVNEVISANQKVAYTRRSVTPGFQVPLVVSAAAPVKNDQRFFSRDCGIRMTPGTMAAINWDAISAISQLIGSVAVVLSVLYLAAQVHQSTRVARLAMQDAAATALREVTKPLMENAELERIWRVGLEDIGALSVEERARFFHAAYQFLKAFETIHFHHVYGMMDRDLWEGWHGLLRHYVFAPGMAHYWKLRPEVFSQRFRNFVNSLEPPADQRTVGTLFKEERK
jgi:hypothetical protein